MDEFTRFILACTMLGCFGFGIYGLSRGIKDNDMFMFVMVFLAAVAGGFTFMVNVWELLNGKA